MPTAAAALRKLRWSVTQRGLLETFRFALLRLGAGHSDKPEVHPFDLRHGVDTSGLIGGADLATGHEHDRYNTAYYGMSPSRFAGAIEIWRSLAPPAPTESYTFLDLGCGKGRAVLMATELPFREVIGVEIHPGLAGVAGENLRRWQAAGKSRSPARIVCGDATETELPAGPCLLYLFNPFARPVVERLARRLASRFADRKGMLDVIYFNPEEAEAFEAEEGFRRMWRGTMAMSEEDAAADLVASPEDLCELYRWVGPGRPG